VDGFTTNINDTVRVLTTSGSRTGFFTSVTPGWVALYGSNYVDLQYAVPEPATVLALAVGAMGLLRARRRRDG
jgi:hypothetical protein